MGTQIYALFEYGRRVLISFRVFVDDIRVDAFWLLRIF